MNLQSGRILVVSTIAIMILGFFVHERGNSTVGSDLRISRTSVSCPTDDPNQYSTRDRTTFDLDAPMVLGYPSTGGVLMLPFDIAIAEYLGIPRLGTAYRASDPIEEDKFCDRLRLLGAKWWKSQDTYVRKLIGIEEMTEMERKEAIIVGWPGEEEKEGVWVLRSSRGTQKLVMCVNMRERCQLLEKWGATFYEDSRDVEEFRRFFEEKGDECGLKLEASRP
ncbi:hypothetical protein Slin15195_G101000 [Septoria linicola]|uniref:Uncharacterized protein n=1 Tax=Septoria linicola TaxID=215465 RepID=A0A9Q9B3Y9_9PEZI|nr:hypothetical protein Slin15195_G101000 [Septoria linicola]